MSSWKKMLLWTLCSSPTSLFLLIFEWQSLQLTTTVCWGCYKTLRRITSSKRSRWILWEGLLLDVNLLRKERRTRRTRKWCKMLGHLSSVRPRNPSLIRVRQNASTAKSRGTKKEIVLNTLRLCIRTDREKSKLLLDKVIIW